MSLMSVLGVCAFLYYLLHGNAIFAAIYFFSAVASFVSILFSLEARRRNNQQNE